MNIYGLVGYGIGYSLSKKLHMAAISTLNRKNEIYETFDLPPYQVGEFLEHFEAMGGKGLNVTQPYKNLMANLTGADLPAVNTLKLTENGWQGYSTDGVGLANAMKKFLKPATDFSNVLILGNGGVIPALLDTFSSAEIQILCRDPGKRQFGVSVEELTVSNLASHIDDADLVIQATSAPVKGDDLGWLVDGLQGFEGTLVDLVYGQVSALYHWAQQRRLPVMEGTPMLIEQARASQEIWWGESEQYDRLVSIL